MTDRIDEIVGTCDHLGRLWCAKCRPTYGTVTFGYPAVIYYNSNPHAFETCEECGAVLNEVDR